MSRWLANLPVRWKILFTPACLILVLIAVGVYALYVQRAAQASVLKLMIGPVMEAEVIAHLNTAMWTAQANLYRLTAVAANETDQKKISALAIQVTKIMADVPEKLNRFEAFKGLDAKTEAKTARLKSDIVGYVKQAMRRRHGR